MIEEPTTAERIIAACNRVLAGDRDKKTLVATVELVRELAFPLVDEWRCFHCGESFRREEDAREHFGGDRDALAACQIKGHEHQLIRKIREQEELLRDYENEDNALLRAWEGMQSEHATALRQAEETGYNRGVLDARNYPVEL